jgi:hypothetical protein
MIMALVAKITQLPPGRLDLDQRDLTQINDIGSALGKKRLVPLIVNGAAIPGARRNT